MTKKQTNTTKRAESRTRYFVREKAQKRGWNVAHPASNGHFLEENEIISYFPNIGLGQERPDFVMVLNGIPVAIIEAKNESGKLATAIKEACDYADLINAHGKYMVYIAIGAAGDEDNGFEVAVWFKTKTGNWIPLESRGAALTAIPSKAEIELALQANDGTTRVTIPDQSEFIDAAIESSMVLRLAKVEAPLRPKVVGALVAAMYDGKIDIDSKKALASVNKLMRNTLNNATDLQPQKRKQLIDALELTGADFNRLSPFIGRIVTILNRLNIKAVLQTDTDFLGMFYEAFLRYGYDNNALGIVFTPRHITKFCVRLTDIEPTYKVIDIASGTGGFLVAAFDAMRQKSISDEQLQFIKQALYGFDTNPTIWALASLNMFFRGDGKNHMENASCFDPRNKKIIARQFDRAYLNPPFSQQGEPESMFIDEAMETLKPGGILAAVVLAGVFADDEHKNWRRNFLTHHRLLGVISLPEDLFYPTSAPTSIVVAKAHVPHGNKEVFMGRIWNDGYEKLKGKRIKVSEGQLEEIADNFSQFSSGEINLNSPLAITIDGGKLAKGEEWSPQQWLPQPTSAPEELEKAQAEVVRSIFKAVVQFPELANEVISDFGAVWNSKPELPYNVTKPLSFFFEVGNGKSSGEKNYPEGTVPYISSGDQLNSIVRLVEPLDDYVFENGAITITAFGQACVQPWKFLARGNGGSSVRLLVPKYKMSVRELVWFAAQINLQRWRFFYLRQAIKSRLESGYFQVSSPANPLADSKDNLALKLRRFRASLEEQSVL